jgi:hypothetical protein
MLLLRLSALFLFRLDDRWREIVALRPIEWVKFSKKCYFHKVRPPLKKGGSEGFL